jgi:hypothetical protein
MTTSAVVFAAVFGAVGLIMIGLAVPLIRRRVAPNGVYGLRVPATIADKSVWYEANARFGRDLAAFGIIQICAAVVPPVLLELRQGSPAAITYGLGNVVLCGIGAVVIAIVGWMRAERLLKQRPSR